MRAVPSLTPLPASTENSAANLTQQDVPKQHQETALPVPCIKATFVKNKRRIVVIGVSLLRGMETQLTRKPSVPQELG